MTLCFIALGSNLDQPLLQIQRALEALEILPHCQQLSCSRWYQSKAIGPGEQADYINAVVQLETTLTPPALLQALQHIEHQQQRVRTQRWGPRTLDLDLLLYGQEVINHSSLTVPHPRLFQRNFVLYPLFDLCPDLHFPDGTSLRSRLDYCSQDGLNPVETITITERQLEPGQH